MSTLLGLKEVRRRVDEKNKLHAGVPGRARTTRSWSRTARSAGRDAPLVELTYNWDTEDYGEARYFGHLAYEVDDIYATCDKLMKAGVTINRPPRDGNMAFVRSPDKHSIELLQKGKRAAAEGTLGLDAEHRALVRRAEMRPTGRARIRPACPPAPKLSISRAAFRGIPASAPFV